VDFVEICKVCATRTIIKAAQRTINSDKMCRSYSDLNFGVTFFGTQCRVCPVHFSTTVFICTAALADEQSEARLHTFCPTGTSYFTSFPSVSSAPSSGLHAHCTTYELCVCTDT